MAIAPSHPTCAASGSPTRQSVAAITPRNSSSATCCHCSTNTARAGLEQKRKGLYTYFWQLPGIAEASLQRAGYAELRHWARQHPDVEECIRDMSRPGRLTAGLNWYRASALPVLFGSWPKCRVPVRGVIGAIDSMLAEDQMASSSRHMEAPWDFVRIEQAGHWLPLETPRRVVELADDWFRRN